MTDDVRADLQIVHYALAGFGPRSLHRSDDLVTHKETLATCATRLEGLPEPNDVHRRLTDAAASIARAEEIRAHPGRGFVIELLNRNRFAWAVRAARGNVEGALNTLDELAAHA